jgi:FAD-dependent urate hydroxylase
MNSWQRIQPTDGGQPGKISPLPRSRDQRDATVTAGVPPVFPVEDDYRIALLDAEASFITTFLGKIEAPRTAGPGHGRPTTPASTQVVTRARELGYSASKPAQRPIPLWCTFPRSASARRSHPNAHFRVMAPPSLLPSVFAEERHATRCQRHDRSRPVNRARTAMIIGGSIAGPATAMALAKAGLEATVYEARPHGADGGGVMLTLAVNGIDALRTLGADAAAVAAGFPTPQITLRTHTGKRLGVTSTGGALADGTVAHTIRRADLYQALHSQAVARGITVLHGKRLVGAQEYPGGVQATFADGTQAQADILVGCDGVHSTVRGLIDPAAPAPSYAGLLNTGGFASGVTVAAPPGSYEMIFGKRAFFGYTTAPDGQVWWFANLPQHREPARGEAEMVSAAQGRHRFTEIYAEDAGPALELIAATPGFAPMTPIHTIPHLRRWHTGRMIVVGDAGARSLAHLRAGRLAVYRGRCPACDLAAGHRTRVGGVHALRNGAPPPRGEDHQGRRPDHQQQGTEPGRTPAARPDAAGDPAGHRQRQERPRSLRIPR